ncbi:MAG: enoyl-CoA hydratase/isomerase family protein, partial [Planctomycetaceae bacterium]
MSASYVTTAIDAGIAEITLNRPAKRNALHRAFLQELNTAVRSVAADATVRLLTLSAAGPVFCAGMDLGEMQERAGRSDAQPLWNEDTRSYRDL